MIIVLLVLLSGCASGGDSIENFGSDGSNNNSNSSDDSAGNGNVISENFGMNPTVATSIVDGHVNVYVAWEEPFGQQPSVVFRRSTDGGIIFEPPLSEPPRRLPFSVIPDGSHPVLAALGEDVYLVWVGGLNQGNSEILFSVSHDAGKSFTSPVSVSGGGRTSVSPALAASQSFVYVTWLDQGSGDILLRRSVPTGEDFDNDLIAHPILNLSNNGTATSAATSSVSTANGNVYVTWDDSLTNDRGGNQVEDVLFVKSNDEGQNFSSPENLSLNLSNSTHPVVAADGQNVYVVWEDFSSSLNSNSVLFFQRSTDGGETFDQQNTIEITLSGVTATGPRMAASGDHVFIVWDNPAPNPNPDQEGSLQIFFAKSDDQGKTFSIPSNISENPSNAKKPAISAINGQAYVVWQGQVGTGTEAQDKIFFYRP